MKMKTLLSILTILTFTSSVFAQDSYDELIKKSRRARTTGIVLVSVGPVIAAGGIGTLIYGLVTKDDGYGSTYVNGNYVVDNRESNTAIVVGAVAAGAGIALALTSIHFSKKANDLKREARKTKLKTSTGNIFIPGLQNGATNNRARQFKVSLVVPLGR